MQNSSSANKSQDYRLHHLISRVLTILLVVEWGILLYQQAWLSLFLVTLIFLTIFLPTIFYKQMEVEIPVEFHTIAVLFVFSALYLGEVQNFYYKFWWWDVALHTAAGLLMGFLGFLLVYVLNENKRVHISLTPAFVAFFAFTFSLAVGALWEIFEFAMDQFIGTNMQKAFLNDTSGLTDTMWDMIVNAIGALIVSAIGYLYLKTDRRFFVRRWLKKITD